MPLPFPLNRDRKLFIGGLVIGAVAALCLPYWAVTVLSIALSTLSAVAQPEKDAG